MAHTHGNGRGPQAHLLDRPHQRHIHSHTWIVGVAGSMAGLLLMIYVPSLEKEQALREMFRVLKPGGRFLMAVWVPGWTMFAVANVLSFFLTSKEGWRTMARRAGFEVADEGVFNFAWFAVLEKPAAAAT